MRSEKLIRPLLRLIIAGSVLWTVMCLICGGFTLLVNRPPRYGDNMGFGIVCITIPLTVICTVAILAAVEKWLIRRN